LVILKKDKANTLLLAGLALFDPSKQYDIYILSKNKNENY